ncbi:hypothetical protein KIN20_020843, partial [Parelaphostrongylus tenuis]
MPSRETRSKDRIKGARHSRTRHGLARSTSPRPQRESRSRHSQLRDRSKSAESAVKNKGKSASSGSPHMKKQQKQAAKPSSVSSKEKQAGSPKKLNLPTGKTLGKEATTEKKKEFGTAKSSPSRERLAQ